MATAAPTEISTIPSLQSYSNLGNSGLRVSPLCLGTMTFGTEWGWGSPADTARTIFEAFLASGANFIDTADGYTMGTSEKLLGEFMQAAGNRDQIVLATKYTFPIRQGDPNAFGNSRKHLYEALHASLKRLQTDYIDLYWMHAWDTLTPVEEVVATMNTMVEQGKIRYWGLSDVPGWYAGRAYTLAETRGWAKPIALQLEYSLIERHIEFEFVPAAHALGMGITPWSPLGGGLLSGKYTRESYNEADGRLNSEWQRANPLFNKFTDRNFAIIDTLLKVAKAVGQSPAQVALNWATTRPGVTSTIIGATKMSQLEDNLGALEFTLPAELRAELDTVSTPTSHFPYTFFKPENLARFTGGLTMQVEPKWWRG